MVSHVISLFKKARSFLIAGQSSRVAFLAKVTQSGVNSAFVRDYFQLPIDKHWCTYEFFMAAGLIKLQYPTMWLTDLFFKRFWTTMKLYGTEE